MKLEQVNKSNSIVGAIILLVGIVLGVVINSPFKIDTNKIELKEMQEKVLRAEGQADLIRQLYTDGCRDDLRVIFGEHVNKLHRDIYEPQIIPQEMKIEN